MDRGVVMERWTTREVHICDFHVFKIIFYFFVVGYLTLYDLSNHIDGEGQGSLACSRSMGHEE